VSVIAGCIQSLRHIFDEILYGLRSLRSSDEAFGDCVSAPAGAALG